MPITIKQIENRWWLVNEADEAFVSLGFNHIQPDCFLAPYNTEATLERYGDDLMNAEGVFNQEGKAIENLLGSVKQRMGELGFNSLGMHTYHVPPRTYINDVYYAIAIDAFPIGSKYKFKEQNFPDIYGSAFRELLEARVKEVCEVHADSTNLIGYAYSDIPRWYFFGGGEGKPPLHQWVRDLLSMDADAPAKKALINAMQERLVDVAKLKSVLGIELASWEDALSWTSWDGVVDEVGAKQLGDHLLATLVRQWYELHRELIRKYDSQHMLLGDKLHSPHHLPGWFLPILDEHVDILFIQWYTPAEDQLPTLRKLYERLGKPILNGDSCFGCVKPPKQTKVKGYKVESQAAVGQAYYDYLKGVISEPYMIGWHHCGFVEQWDGGKKNDWEINENGFYDPFEKPYDEIIKKVKEANAQAHEWHTG